MDSISLFAQIYRLNAGACPSRRDVKIGAYAVHPIAGVFFTDIGIMLTADINLATDNANGCRFRPSTVGNAEVGADTVYPIIDWATDPNAADPAETSSLRVPSIQMHG